MSKSSVSIVVATFNSEVALADAALRWRAVAGVCEIIVQDGASSDHTIEILEKLRQDGVVSVVNSEKDDGVYDAWNKAVLHCRGDWILFYGDEDVIPMEWISELGKLSPKQHDIVTGALTVRSPAGETLAVSKGWKPKSRDLVFNETLLPHVGMAHSRSIFDGNGFDTKYKIAGDRELLIRLWPLRVASIPNVSQGEMVLGGLSNSPKAFAQARDEDVFLIHDYGLHPSITKRMKMWIKGILSKQPRLWMLAQNYYLRARPR